MTLYDKPTRVQNNVFGFVCTMITAVKKGDIECGDCATSDNRRYREEGGTSLLMTTKPRSTEREGQSPRIGTCYGV